MDREYIVYIRELKSKKMVVEVSQGEIANGYAQNEGKLVYYEVKNNIRTAMAREKKLKSLNRLKLIEMVRNNNPEMLDLRNTLTSNDINEINF